MKRLTVIAIIIISFILTEPIFAQYPGGSGTEADPWQIATANDLLYLAEHTEDYNSHFILTADINLADYTFTMAVIAPDTNDAIYFQGTEFNGTFDGNNHLIRNLTIDINSAGNDFLGLFGQIDSDCQIRNLGIEDVNITGGDYWYLGSLVGENRYGTISNCYATGIVNGEDSIWGSWYVGGLVGWNGGKISDCYATCAVTGGCYLGGLVGSSSNGKISDCYATAAVSGNDEVGGLVGTNFNGFVSNCYATGSVSGDHKIGGLVGGNSGTVSNSYATGYIVSRGRWWLDLMLLSRVGGLIGTNSGTVSNSCSTSTVSGEGLWVGGLVGSNSGTVLDSYAIGNSSGDVFVGGLVGSNGGTISTCYATATVSGSNYIGGLVGDNDDGTVSNCYATGAVIGGDYSEEIGGLVGYDDNGSYTSCFWDIDVNPDVNGIGSASDPNVMSRTTAQMKTQSTYTNYGWNFIEIWDIGENQTYPFLRTHLPSDINKDNETNFYDLAILADHWLEGVAY